MLCSTKRLSLILYENELCFLVERPAVCSLVSSLPFASEGFLDWFLRRFSPDSDAKACRALRLGGRELVLVPKAGCPKAGRPLPLDRPIAKASRFVGKASASPDVSGWECGRVSSPDGWRVWHPWLGSAAVFVDAKPLLDDGKHCPRWLDSTKTNAYRCARFALGVGNFCVVDRLGDYFLGQFGKVPQREELDGLAKFFQKAGGKGCYWKVSNRESSTGLASAFHPRLLAGQPMEADYRVRESGVEYRVGFSTGHSFGLFLDQRENRFRFLKNRIAPGFPVFPNRGRKLPLALNAFAYTCGFSVCAALAGAKVFSVDLSRKYLDWGKRNFVFNGLNPEDHEFLHGDVFGWLRRLQRRGRRFDAIVLDPPTFSRSKESGVFQVERDLPRLVETAVGLLSVGGRLLVSCNKAAWLPERFTHSVEGAIRQAGRKIGKRLFASQPWDFGWTTGKDASLKSWWFEIL